MDASLQTQIASLVARVIADSTGRSLSLDLDDPLISSGYLDSMSMVNLVITMQSELGIDLDITDMSAENFETVRCVTELVERRR